MPITPVINYWAVLVAAVTAIILGSIWYGPLFGKSWMKLSGISREAVDSSKKKGMWKYYLANFIAALIFAYILSHFVDYTESSTITDAFQLGFWIWLGFIATILLGTVLWEGKSYKLYILNAGYRLIEIFLMAIILVLWP